MEITDKTRSRFILVLGILIVLQACMGGYFLLKGETTSATTAFSTLAALSASMAAVSASRGDDD
jgi:uncharacterized protein (UPF0333 family)